MHLNARTIPDTPLQYRRREYAPSSATRNSRVRRTASSGSAAHRTRVTNPAILHMAQVSVPEISKGLKPSDQLHILFNRLQEVLSRNPNVGKAALSIVEGMISGEVYLRNFSRESRYEIYRMESATISQFPAVELNLVVLPLVGKE